VPNNQQQFAEALNQIGNLLRSRRAYFRLTQKELGDLAGLTRVQVSYMEHAMSNPPIGNLIRVAIALDMPFEELVKPLIDYVQNQREV
jgi:transcriptional regulator with XRE-family HTH domain